MDFLQFQCHFIQQVDFVDCWVPYVYPESSLPINNLSYLRQWINDSADFPIFLTSWHLGFATLMTQILARTTNLLDGRKTVKMTGRVYLRAIVPIGVFFSLSLICGNLTYLYLSVSFIQMLKVCLVILRI